MQCLHKFMDIETTPIKDVFNIYESLRSYGEETRYKTLFNQAIQRYKQHVSSISLDAIDSKDVYSVGYSLWAVASTKEYREQDNSAFI